MARFSAEERRPARVQVVGRRELAPARECEGRPPERVAKQGHA
jgi:hypothetical protein